MFDVTKRNLVLEVAITTVVLVGITRILYSFQNIPLIGKYYVLIFALLFLYVPVIIIRKRGRDVDFVDRRWAEYVRSFSVFLICSAIIFPLFFIAAHGWERIVLNASGPVFVRIPNLGRELAYQFIMVSLPEEFFFRGYVQTTLNQVLQKKWRLFGADLGWAWIVTAVMFAVVHSVVTLRWWHFAIFFPALVMGYLRERTGSITASILFHGTSNLAMTLIGYWYLG